MAKTTLLPTATAVRIVWAMTGKSSNDAPSRTMATYIEDVLKHIEDQAQAQGINPKEKSYVTSAIVTMKVSLRSLDIVYKGRTLNFKENEELRTAYLMSVKESLSFGDKAQDLLKSLPTMTIVAAGGVTVAQRAMEDASKTILWGVGLVLAALGYLVNFLFVRWSSRRTQMLYVTQDYERGLYYDQYVSRVTDILIGLFLDLERIHKRVFQESYETDTNPSALEGIINEILVGVHSTFCPYAHKHMRDKKITPKLWPLCESGNAEAVRKCKRWEGQSEAAPSTRNKLGYI